MNYRQLASKGRYGDTELAHVNPQEANLLRALGGSGTINPKTGLREYSWLSSIWDSVTSSDLNPSNWSVGGQNLGLGDIWNSTWGNEGIGGAVSDWISGIGGSDLNPGNWSIGGQNVGDYMFGGGLSGDYTGSDFNPSNWSVGGQNLGLGDLWNNTLGNQGLGGLLTGANPSVGGWAGNNLGPMWNQTYGNQGVGGWLQSLLGGGSSGGPIGGGQGGGSSGGPIVPGSFNLGKQSGGRQGGGGGRMRTPLGQNPFEKSPLGNLFRGQQPSGRSIRPRRGY